MDKGRVAIVDDDANLRLVISTYLEGDGYSSLEAECSASLLKLLDSDNIDIILLDLNLGGEDGLMLLPQIKQKTSAPVIIVSGKTEMTDRVVGLEMGADDYMTKPFEMRELSARIKANLRRVQAPATQNDTSSSQQSNGSVQMKNVGEWKFDTNKLQLVHLKSGEIEDLTKNEYDLLTTFVNSPNRALSRDYLYESLKEEDYNSFDRAIDVQVTRLRKKLQDDPQKPRYIKTVRGVGYMFIADV